MPAAPTDRTPLAARFEQVRSLTDTLTSRLSAEDQTPQSMTDASPTKWHRAHTTWFFEEFVLRGRPDYTEFDPTFRYLFNSYYEAIGPRHPRPYRRRRAAFLRHHHQAQCGPAKRGDCRPRGHPLRGRRGLHQG